MAGCCSEIEFNGDVLCALLQTFTADDVDAGVNFIGIDGNTCHAYAPPVSTFVNNNDGSFTHTNGLGVAVTIAICDLIGRGILPGVAATNDQYVTLGEDGLCKLVDAPDALSAGAVTPAGEIYPVDGNDRSIVGIVDQDGVALPFDAATGIWTVQESCLVDCAGVPIAQDANGCSIIRQGSACSTQQFPSTFYIQGGNVVNTAVVFNLDFPNPFNCPATTTFSWQWNGNYLAANNQQVWSWLLESAVTLNGVQVDDGVGNGYNAGAGSNIADLNTGDVGGGGGESSAVTPAGGPALLSLNISSFQIVNVLRVVAESIQLQICHTVA